LYIQVQQYPADAFAPLVDDKTYLLGATNYLLAAGVRTE
jgi:hypothetical protein